MSRDPRDWQKDMEMCGHHVQPLVFAYEAREALPYWLQQAAEWKAIAYKAEVKANEVDFWKSEAKQAKRDNAHWMCKHTAAEQKYLTQSNVIAELRKRDEQAEEREQLLKEAINKSLIIYRTSENAEENMMYTLENVLCNIYPLDKEDTTNETDPM